MVQYSRTPPQGDPRIAILEHPALESLVLESLVLEYPVLLAPLYSFLLFILPKAFNLGVSLYDP